MRERQETCVIGKGMRRLRRIMFNALTVLSVVLCVATVCLWVRSYGGELVIGHSGSWGQSGAVASRGLLLGIRERVVYRDARVGQRDASGFYFDPPARSVDRYWPPWSGSPYPYGRV